MGLGLVGGEREVGAAAGGVGVTVGDDRCALPPPEQYPAVI